MDDKFNQTWKSVSYLILLISIWKIRMSLNQSQIGLRAVDLKKSIASFMQQRFRKWSSWSSWNTRDFKKNLLKAEEVAEERRAFHQRLEERRSREDSLDSSSIRQDICQQLYSWEYLSTTLQLRIFVNNFTIVIFVNNFTIIIFAKTTDDIYQNLYTTGQA